MLKLLMKTEIDGAASVELFQTGFGYAVRYGLEVNSNMSKQDAFDAYAASLQHAMACAGLELEDDREAEDRG